MGVIAFAIIFFIRQTGLVDVALAGNGQLVAVGIVHYHTDITEYDFPKDEIIVEGVCDHIVTEMRAADVLECPFASASIQFVPRSACNLLGLGFLACHTTCFLVYFLYFKMRAIFRKKVVKLTKAVSISLLTAFKH